MGSTFRITRKNLLTKAHIFSQFTNDDELKKFIPTDVKIASLTRELMLSILAYIRKDKYLSLYAIYKTTKLQRSTIGSKHYDIEIQSNFVDKIKEYISVSK